MADEKKEANYELPLVVEILPGTASKGYLVALKKDAYEQSIEDILNDAVASTPRNRDARSAQDVLKIEYTSTAKVTISGASANRKDKLKTFGNQMELGETDKKIQYNMLKIRVANQQEGGLYL